MQPVRHPEFIDLKTLYLLFTGYELFSDFAGNIINGIFIADAKGDTLWVSSGCEQLWGYTAAELYGKNVVDLERKGVWKPSGVRKVLEASKRVMLTQETGVGRLLRIVGNPIFSPSGGISRVVNGALDIGPPGKDLGVEAAYDSFFQGSAMHKVNSLIERLAPLDVTVLLTGESGTGKELVARRIHKLHNPNRPFVKIDCATIAPNLLESELFGYESGAFSGAERGGKKGLVETAENGTLFLDEIGEIPLSLQSKFLRLVQDKTYIKVGGTREHKLEARIIAATNRDLEKMVENKEFRLDLYFRLNVLPIYLLPLRERKNDIPGMVQYFRARFKQRFGYTRRFCQRTLDCLQAYRWPGNIRELENFVERMLITMEHDTIDACDLPLAMSGETYKQPLEINDLMPLKDCLRLTEENLLHMAWQKYRTTTGVAKSLGIDQSTASRKLRKLRMR